MQIPPSPYSQARDYQRKARRSAKVKSKEAINCQLECSRSQRVRYSVVGPVACMETVSCYLLLKWCHEMRTCLGVSSLPNSIMPLFCPHLISDHTSEYLHPPILSTNQSLTRAVSPRGVNKMSPSCKLILWISTQPRSWPWGGK